MASFRAAAKFFVRRKNLEYSRAWATLPSARPPPAISSLKPARLEQKNSIVLEEH